MNIPKSLLISSAFLIIITTSAFATQPCIECETSSFYKDSNAAISLLDNLQQQTDLNTFESSLNLSLIVLKKLSARKAETESIFDHLQRETENISIAQPILIISSAIEKKLHVRSRSRCNHSNAHFCSK